MQKDFNAGDEFKVIYLCDTKMHDTFNDERKALESYYYCCLKSWGIKMYNSSKIHYADNYFLRAGRLDDTVRELIKFVKTY